MKNFSSILSEKIEELAIGKFDGMHLAHQRILEKLGKNAGVLVIAHNKSEYLCSPDLKKKLIRYEIFELLLDEIRGFSGEDFVRFLKKKFPKLKRLVVGYDFCFGKNRACDCYDLQNFFEGSVEIVPEILYNGFSVHAQKIQEILKETGDVRFVNTLLGRIYQVEGKIIKGQGIGKKMLYPTLNLDVQGYVLPKSGVYACFLGEKKVFCATFIGTRSTDSCFSVEVHVLGEFKEEYQETGYIDLYFVDRVRDVKHFANLQDLKKQITQDIQSVKNILKSIF